MSIVDPWALVSIGLTLIVVFLLALLVPRRPRVMMLPATDLKLDALTTRLNDIEALNAKRLHDIEERQAKNDHDTKNIRMAMKNMPTQKSVGELMLQVATLDGNVKNLTGKVDNLQDILGTNGHTLNRIQDFLFSAAAESIVNKHRAD